MSSQERNTSSGDTVRQVRRRPHRPDGPQNVSRRFGFRRDFAKEQVTLAQGKVYFIEDNAFVLRAEHRRITGRGSQMKDRHILMVVILAAASCTIMTLARAQSAAPVKDSPRKSEPTPRLTDGHPDFSGVWYPGVIKDIDHIPPNENHRGYDP